MVILAPSCDDSCVDIMIFNAENFIICWKFCAQSATGIVDVRFRAHSHGQVALELGSLLTPNLNVTIRRRPYSIHSPLKL